MIPFHPLVQNAPDDTARLANEERAAIMYQRYRSARRMAQSVHALILRSATRLLRRRPGVRRARGF